MFLNSWLQLAISNWPILIKIGIQLLILLSFIYLVYERFIRSSHAEQLIKGLFITLLTVVGLWSVAHFLNFPLLEVVFGATIQLLMIGLIVIFQPELRRMLFYLGQPEWFGRPNSVFSRQNRSTQLAEQLAETVRFLRKSKTGALIVLESTQSGGNYLEAGTPVDACLSIELLLTIFHPKTPLHDGAVIINAEGRIAAAGVLLPLTEDPKLSWQYGTRHRAALGLTESSDNHCIVVSEETGAISLAYRGALEKIAQPEDLRKRLAKMFSAAVSVSPTPAAMVKEDFTERFTGFFSTESFPDRLQKIFSRRDTD